MRHFKSPYKWTELNPEDDLDMCESNITKVLLVIAFFVMRPALTHGTTAVSINLSQAQ